MQGKSINVNKFFHALLKKIKREKLEKNFVH